MMLCALVLILGLGPYARGANILGYFPAPSPSHQRVFQPIWRELSLKGHNVTIISPMPLLDQRLTNLTELDVSASFSPSYQDEVFKKFTPSYSVASRSALLYGSMQRNVELQWRDETVERLIHSDQEFDIVILQPFTPLSFAFPAKFRVPYVAISSFGILMQSHDSVGNPTHPLLYKDIFFSYDGNPTFLKRVYGLLYQVWYRALYYWYFLPKADKVARKYFGDDIPYLGDVENNVSLVLINENPVMNTIRPNVPNVIPVSQVHIQKEKKPLPKDIQDYLDKSTQGVVYLSLGSNVKSTGLAGETRQAIIDALSELPYNVLWKWESDHLPGKPKNVMTKKWLPQQDILGHPNIKAFVTQGGFQSIDEAIYDVVPMVGIPFMSDQPENVRRLVELGMALRIDHKQLTKDMLKSAILEVAKNPSFRQQVKKAKMILEDEPIKGLDKAIWWIEYVIRHKGAPHLRSPLADMSFFEYFMLDVVGFILAVVIIVPLALIYILRKLLKLKRSFLSNEKKVKKS